MTPQEIFDTVVRGLKAQGKPSIDGGVCRYRTWIRYGTVLKCAVGLLIPDNEYQPDMEVNEEGCGTNLSDVLDRLSDKSLLANAQLLSILQAAHDNAALNDPGMFFIEGFLIRAKIIASQFGLDPAETHQPETHQSEAHQP